MADLPVLRTRNDLTKPTVKVQKLLKQQQIAEKEARVQRLKADAFEIVNGRLKGIEVDIIMGERDVAKLKEELDQLESQGDAEVINV